MKKLLLAATLALASAPLWAALPAGLSGAWYNPAQSGHGIHLEMVSGDRAIGAWNVFDTAGNPVHLYLEGEVIEQRLVLRAYAPRGMKFGSFDRSNFSAPRWGSMTIAFNDCDHAAMSYTADGPAGAGYGSGSMPLKRLTGIAGLACDFDTTLSSVPAGAWEASWDWPGSSFTGPAYAPHVAVDRQGRLWATSAWTPGPTYVSAVGYSPVLAGDAPMAEGNGLTAGVTALYNVAFAPNRIDSPAGTLRATTRFAADAGGQATATITGAAPFFSQFTATRAPGANVLDDPGFDLASLDGKRFAFTTIGQFFEFRRVIEFGRLGADHICILNAQYPSLCEYEGRVTGTEDGLAMFDFVLGYSGAQGPYQGKGWIRPDTGVLVMVAAGNGLGLGFVATPEG